MDAFEQLLELQTIDTEIAQLEHRAAHLPEAVVLSDARGVIATLRAELSRITNESAAFAAVVETNEASVNDVRRQLERLNAQMKTVIAPREAEALQHEMAVMATKISSLEDESLAAFERSDELDAEMARLGSQIAAATGAVDEAERAFQTALDEVRASLVTARERRGASVAGIDVEWVAQYDRRRADQGGIAVARLIRATCGGCHLDLSTSEVEAVRREDATRRECPNCARWLVV